MNNQNIINPNETSINRTMQRVGEMDVQISEETGAEAVINLKDRVLDIASSEIGRNVETTVDILQLVDENGNKIFAVGRDDRLSDNQQVVLLEINQFNANDPGNVYPKGKSVMTITGTEPNFPYMASIVETTHLSANRVSQTCQAIGFNRQDIWTRVWRFDFPSVTGWSEWISVTSNMIILEFLQQKYGDEFQQFLESKAGEQDE